MNSISDTAPPTLFGRYYFHLLFEWNKSKLYKLNRLTWPPLMFKGTIFFSKLQRYPYQVLGTNASEDLVCFQVAIWQFVQWRTIESTTVATGDRGCPAVWPWCSSEAKSYAGASLVGTANPAILHGIMQAESPLAVWNMYILVVWSYLLI